MRNTPVYESEGQVIILQLTNYFYGQGGDCKFRKMICTLILQFPVAKSKMKKFNFIILCPSDLGTLQL